MEFGSAVSTYVLGCSTEARYKYPIRVGVSWIPESGMGLFATECVAKGSVIGRYYGTVLDTKSALRTKDKSYLMRLGAQCYVDSKNTWTCLPRFINDCRNSEAYNVEFVKSPEEKCAWVKAIRDIKAGEEIYVDYGKWYWASLKAVRVSTGFIKAKMEIVCS